MSLTPSTETEPRPLRTRQEVADWFRQSGISITAWAKANGLNRDVVYRLIYGACKGRRGNSHRAAVLLGMKAAPAPEATHAL